MVALLRPQPGSPYYQGPKSGSAVGGRQLRLVVDNTKIGTNSDNRDNRANRVSSANRARTFDARSERTSAVEARSNLALAVVAAVLVFGALFGIRMIQGSPVAAGLAEAQPAGTASAVSSASAVASGGQVITAKSGDSLWSIAQAVAPESDPRPVVNALIEANGTDVVQIGQQIVIPRHLLD